jgi:DNA-binding CsgD family transcriptional regulator
VEPDEPLDQLAIARAVQSTLALVANDAVTLAVDDLQWLDASTAAALAFALRRAEDLRLRLVFARRAEGGAEPALDLEWVVGEPARLRLAPLTVDELDELLRGRHEQPLSHPRVVALHRLTGGNPFLALELARDAERRGTSLADAFDQGVPAGARALVGDRLEALSPAAADVVVLVALAGRPSRELVTAAGGTAAGVRDALEADAIRDEGARLELAHPLLGAAAAARAGADGRRAAHLRLAAAATDAEERALHLAAGSDRPSARAAADVERGATLAHARGAPATAAELAEAAARLTPRNREAEARRRLVAAAEHYAAAGDMGRARSLLERLRDELGPGAERAEIRWRLVDLLGDPLPVLLRECEAALAEAGEDPALVAAIQLQAATLHLLRAEPGAAEAAARACSAAAEAGGDTRLQAAAIALVAQARVLRGSALPVRELERARALELEVDRFPVFLRPSFVLGILLTYLDRLDEARPLLQDELARIEEHGHDSARAGVLFRLVELECRAGRWGEARAAAVEAAGLAGRASTEQEESACLAGLALVNAHLGLVDEARDAAERALALAERLGDRINELRNRGVLGFVELSGGEPAAALAWLRPAVEILRAGGILEVSPYPIVQNAVEAAIEAGEWEEAEALIALAERAGRSTGREWPLAVAERGRALLLAERRDFEGARRAARDAVARHERLPQPFELARALLVLGRVERRTGRRRAARAQLTRALQLFDDLGAALWAERAAGELARLGGRSPASDELTPSERRVADLVAEGRTNAEVAAALSVTVRTVETHLTHVYAKLGVRGRAELVRRLAGS